MGGRQSSLESVVSADCFCITFRKSCKIRVIDADKSVIDIVRHSIRRSWKPGVSKDAERYGAWDFDLVGKPLRQGSGKEESTQIKKLVCVLLQDLLASGWRTEACSDLSCISGLNINRKGSLFFVRSEPPGVDTPVFCASLSKEDKLKFVNMPANLLSVVREVVSRTWTAGVQEDFKEVCGAMEMKVCGTPWNSGQRASVDARRLLLHLIRDLARHHWVLYVSCGLKDTADSLFFVYHSDGASTEMVDTSWIMSLNQTDRIRMVEADPSVQEIVKDVVAANWSGGIQNDGDYHGARELKLKGNPWLSEGQELVDSRKMVTMILQELRRHGWLVLETIQMSRRPDAKSVFVFTRGTPETAPLWCVCLSVTDTLRFIDVPEKLLEDLRTCVSSEYKYGIQAEKTQHEVHNYKLNGNPWYGDSGNESLHGHHLMVALLRAMRARGCTLVCSADLGLCGMLDASFEHLSVHSWWFCGQPDSAAAPPSYGASRKGY